jgi:hypothetical protein
VQEVIDELVGESLVDGVSRHQDAVIDGSHELVDFGCDVEPGGQLAASGGTLQREAQVYMPISAQGGELLYTLIRAVRPATVIEFGTSFGISTLYLAAAVRDNGAGRVISTELNASKAAAARRTFASTAWTT